MNTGVYIHEGLYKALVQEVQPFTLVTIRPSRRKSKFAYKCLNIFFDVSCA